MKILYLDCKMGAAGDMLTAALLELLPDPEAFLEELNSLGIPGVQIKKEVSVKCGINGTHIIVTVNGQEEFCDQHSSHHEHEHEHSHDHEHTHEHNHHHEEHTNESTHTHHHSGMHEIRDIIETLNLSAKIQSDVLAVYSLIAEAESHAHGVPITDIHFHEVGTMDAIADITAFCMLINKIAPEQIIVSPIHVGSGHVKCSHGILPVPAPATAYILKNVPIYGGGIKGELCTPTGAALLKHFATQFGDMPVIKTQAIGYGMGKKDFEAVNCVRALLGETQNSGDTVTELCCNLDDMTPEAIGFAMDCFFAAGALDVYTISIGMKKSRPGILLCIICQESDRDNMIRLIFANTSTLGIRENISNRYTLNRTITDIDTPVGKVRQKFSSGYGITRTKYEYEDISRIAREKGLSLADITKLIDGK